MTTPTPTTTNFQTCSQTSIGPALVGIPKHCWTKTYSMIFKYSTRYPFPLELLLKNQQEKSPLIQPNHEMRKCSNCFSSRVSNNATNLQKKDNLMLSNWWSITNPTLFCINLNAQHENGMTHARLFRVDSSCKSNANRLWKIHKMPSNLGVDPPSFGLQNYPGKSSCRSLIAKRRTWNSLECLMD